MKRLKILRRWFARKLGFARLMCLALLVLFAGARVWDPPPIQELRLRTFDMFQLIDPRHKAARPVTIVDIDDKSLAKLGQWPWPRTRIADLITNLTGNGAVAIGFDVVFSEPDRLNPDLVASQMRYLDDVNIAPQSGGAQITLDNHETILLKNVIAANLKASDFIFHIT